jgi:uncharacterized protein (TIGR02996 family)
MNDHDALLRAICENPREDTPRLAFADWLDENGQPERAAFIRTDIAMSLRDEWDAERIRWEGLSRSWLSSDWAGKRPLPGLSDGVAWCGVKGFRRGFRWAIRINDLGEFRVRASELFAWQPVAHLSFLGALPPLSHFSSEPWFSRLTGLGWAAGRSGPNMLKPLLDPVPSGLTELDLSTNSVNSDGMRAIGGKPFRKLTHLSLSRPTAQIIAALLESLEADPKTCSLCSLRLEVSHLQGYARGLAACLPPSLRVLDISGGMIHSTGMLAFLGALSVTELKMLKLARNAIGNDGATALFTSPHLAGLKVLDLSYCMVGDEALRALLEYSPLADGLNLLNLTGAPASADMKQAVKERMGDRVRL